MGEQIHVYQGVTYRKVERTAQVGETILIVKSKDSYGDYEDGDVLRVKSLDLDGGVDVEYYGVDGGVTFIWHREYVVLEPIGAESEVSA